MRRASRTHIEMKKVDAPVNLLIRADVTLAAKMFIMENKRKGRKSLSELTENLWISYLRSQGVKLPPLFKNASR